MSSLQHKISLPARRLPAGGTGLPAFGRMRDCLPAARRLHCLPAVPPKLRHALRAARAAKGGRAVLAVRGGSCYTYGMKRDSGHLKEELILAGIREIEAHGVRGFSLRRVAKSCDVSCAAPYKHFTDLNDFFLAIVRYINQQWYRRQDEIVAAYPDDPRRQLTEISVAYIDFLMDNPHFRSIIMLREDDVSAALLHEKSALSLGTARCIRAYCRRVGMTRDVEVRKTFVIRSIIYGAALMFDNGQLPYTEENKRLVWYLIDREFDLP